MPESNFPFEGVATFLGQDLEDFASLNKAVNTGRRQRLRDRVR
jgi:hypothetical protein